MILLVKIAAFPSRRNTNSATGTMGQEFLGVYISSDLSWSLHIKAICNSDRKLVEIFHRFFSIIDANTNFMLLNHLEFSMPNLGS